MVEMMLQIPSQQQNPSEGVCNILFCLLSLQPFVSSLPGQTSQLWQLHVAEQMILDDEVNPDKYKDGKFFESTDEFDEENSVE
ncbi:hypothetical protein MRB53_020815 [Persea americana]|uniref:Uncharacterized protein n=1 Tax=Persea americana TaxID=3435 RepID=A0ACC2L3B0_PERAE|nr:hypothetical protein MRB53_020815 [Persea americana]